mmetsp:Transcript_129687/g.363071  ORF Transcript_129687/g.363071 Transcript_129687/m.363071 type:complete len:215 (+) Transcript_129687:358-1002(+)
MASLAMSSGSSAPRSSAGGPCCSGETLPPQWRTPRPRGRTCRSTLAGSSSWPSSTPIETSFAPQRPPRRRQRPRLLLLTCWLRRSRRRAAQRSPRRRPRRRSQAARTRQWRRLAPKVCSPLGRRWRMRSTRRRRLVAMRALQASTPRSRWKRNLNHFVDGGRLGTGGSGTSCGRTPPSGVGSCSRTPRTWQTQTRTSWRGRRRARLERWCGTHS